MRSRQRCSASRAALVLLVLHAVAACGDESTTGVVPPKGDPRSPTLTIVSGDGQTAEVGTTLPDSLVVVLRDTLGAPVSGMFVYIVRQGATDLDSAMTDGAGRVSVRWTLATTAGTQHIVMRGGVIIGPQIRFAEAMFSAQAKAGAASTLRVSAPNTMGVPGTVFDTVLARVTDRFGNPVADAPVAWSVEAGGGSVRALSSLTDTQGVARAVLTLGPSAGDNVLFALSASLTDRLTVLGSVGLPAMAIAVGGNHSCALTPTGEAYCWGSNQFGQLGIGGAGLPQNRPARVAGGLRFTSLVAGGSHTCGLTSTGEAYCWGSNILGALGFTAGRQDTPTRVEGNHTFTALAAGSSHSCGLTSSGILLCWGDNSAGQRGDGSDRSTELSYATARQAVPAPIASNLSFVALAASHHTTCAIATTGETYCWGGNSLREVGTASAGKCRIPGDYYYNPYDWPCSTSPVRVPLPGRLESITAAGYGVCGVMTDRQLVCWGNDALAPAAVPGAVVSAAWVLGNTGCGVQSDVVRCWGLWTANGISAFPAVNPFGDGVAPVNLSGNSSTSCGVSREPPAIAYCWGSNETGQVGDGTFEYQRFPVAVGLPRASR